MFCEDHFKLGSCINAHELNNTSCTLDSSDNNIPESNNPRDDQPATCEIGNCEKERFAGCGLCYRYLCFNYVDSSECKNDHELGANVTETVNNVIETSETIRPKNIIS